MSISMHKFVVTGAAGWLGKRLVRLMTTDSLEHPDLRGICRGAKIRCLVLPGQKDGPSSLGPGVETMEGDLRNPADCEALCASAEGATLIHAAGIIHPRRVRDLYEVNVEGTRNVLAAAQKAKVRRAVIVSSNSPMGCNPYPDHRFDEHSPYRPYMHYGRSKMQMEQAVQAASAGRWRP